MKNKLWRWILVFLLALSLLPFGAPNDSQPPREQKPVTTLTALTNTTNIQLNDLVNGQVIITQYRADQEGNIHTLFVVIDVQKDVIVAQKVFDGLLKLAPEVKKPSLLYIKDTTNRCVYVVDQKFAILDTIQLRATDGIFSQDGERYYYAEMGGIACHTLQTDNISAIASQYDVRFHSIAGIHPTNEHLIVRLYLDAYEDDTGIAVMDPKTGKYYLLSQDIFTPHLFSNRYLAVQKSTDSQNERLLYGQLYGTSRHVSVDLPYGTANHTWIAGSPYMLYNNSELYYFGSTIHHLSLDSLGISGGLTNAVFLSDAQLIVGISQNALTAIDATTIPHTHNVTTRTPSQYQPLDATIPESFHDTAYNLKVPDSLYGCRLYADMIEQEYGVTILMSNECAIPSAYSGINLSLTANLLEWYDGEAMKIYSALQEMEAALERYPKGFFESFKNINGDGGIRFLLLRSIGAELGTIGYYYLQHEWHNLCLDVTSGSLDSTVCHELWHATEQLINMHNPHLLSDAEWSQYNPPNFVYKSSDQADDKQYAATPDSYFAREYAKTSPAEDRACLMEAVMSVTTPDTDSIMRSDHLKKKLQHISMAIRNTFPDDDWNSVYWERFLK